MKVLVIDDDPAILELVSQYLNLSAQHDVRSENSARAALAAIEESDELFECFLVDIQMPGVDGITLVEFIRERTEYQHTPIIMLTAMEDKDHVDRAFAAGATDYVTKPFDFYDLQIRIHAAQDTAKARARTVGAVDKKAGDDTPDPVHKPLLTDPIALPEIDTAINYDEFENYVRQLLNRRLYRVSAIAVKIGGVEQIHAEFSTAQYCALIHDVAENIRTTLLSVGGILSYRGNGVFMCIPDRRLQGRRNAMQKALNKHHRVVHPILGRFSSNLFVGDQVPLGNGSNASAFAALTLAIESVETQAPGLGELLGASTRLLKTEIGSDEPTDWDRDAGEPIA